MFIHQRHNFVTSAFPVLHATQSLGGKSSLSLKEGSRFDLETCISAPHGHLPSFSLLALSPQTPVRHLASDTPAFIGSPSGTIILPAPGFLAGFLASSISLPILFEYLAYDYPAQESLLAPYCPQDDVGAPPLASRPCLTQPCISSTAPLPFPQMCSALHLGWLFMAHTPTFPPALPPRPTPANCTVSMVTHIIYCPNQVCFDNKGALLIIMLGQWV